jgi:chaperonin GroES
MSSSLNEGGPLFEPVNMSSVITRVGGEFFMKIRPLQDRVLVKRVEAEEKTASGIIIPDNAKEKPLEAEVIAVGNGRRLENGEVVKPELKVGDRVLISKYSGSEVKVNGVEHLILREDDIMGVLV